MPVFTTCLPLKSRVILLVWAALLGAVLLPFCFGYALNFGLLCLLGFCVALILLWRQSGWVRFRVTCTVGLATTQTTLPSTVSISKTNCAPNAPYYFIIERGYRHHAYTQIACSAITTVCWYRSPLLALTNCRVLVCYTGARAFILPPLPLSVLPPLCALLQP